MLTHIVLFKLHQRTPEVRADLRTRLLTLPSQIPQIRHYEVGVDVVQGERSYDVALYSRFESVTTLKEYQIHPAHQAVLQYLREAAQAIVTVDYEVP
jgi:hypothetical protein